MAYVGGAFFSLARFSIIRRITMGLEIQTIAKQHHYRQKPDLHRVRNDGEKRTIGSLLRQYPNDPSYEVPVQTMTPRILKPDGVLKHQRLLRKSLSGIKLAA
jgi:hypothetical protein